MLSSRPMVKSGVTQVKHSWISPAVKHRRQPLRGYGDARQTYNRVELKIICRWRPRVKNIYIRTMKSGGAVENIYLPPSRRPSRYRVYALIGGRFIFTLMASLMSRRAIFCALLASYCWYLVYIWAGAAAARCCRNFEAPAAGCCKNRSAITGTP